MRFVHIDSVTDDMQLAKNIYNEDTGQILLNVGCGIFKYVNKLKNLGYTYIYIDDKFSKNITMNETISEELKVTSKMKLKNIIAKISMAN